MTYKPFIIFVCFAFYLKFPDNIIYSDEVIYWQSIGSTFIKEDFTIFYIDKIIDESINEKVIICLHGFPTSSYDWSKMWPHLTSSFSRVITLDFLGYGFSDKPNLFEKYSIKNQVDLLENLLEEIGVSRFHLLAHDVGDTIVQEMMHRNSEFQTILKYEILSVCLLNGGIFVQTNFPRISQKLMTVPYIGRVFGYMMNFYLFSHGFSEVFGISTKPTYDDLKDFWKLIRHNDGHIVLPLLLQYIVDRQENDVKWTKVLQNSPIPIHVIFGDSDPVNPKQFIDVMRQLIPKASIEVLEGIGHYPQWEAPEETFQSLITFVNQNHKLT